MGLSITIAIGFNTLEIELKFYFHPSKEYLITFYTSLSYIEHRFNKLKNLKEKISISKYYYIPFGYLIPELGVQLRERSDTQRTRIKGNNFIL